MKNIVVNKINKIEEQVKKAKLEDRKVLLAQLQVLVELALELGIDLIREGQENDKKSGIIVSYNEEKNGIELTFNEKPSKETLSTLKENGFRWHATKKLWYAKKTDSTVAVVNKLV